MEDQDKIGALRCIVGARVSTDEQYKKGVSLAHQLDSGRDKAAELGGHVVGYCVEPGVSGSLYEGRPELQAALKQIEEGQADVIIWYDLSRMSRDIEFITAIQKRVSGAGAQLQFVTTEYSNTADGFLHRGIDGVVHQHQRLKLKEVSDANRRKVVASGRQTQRSVSPMGFHVVSRLDVIRGTHTNDQLGYYEIVEPAASVVREIFTRYDAGDSLREICRDLQARGIPTPSGRVTGSGLSAPAPARPADDEAAADEHKRGAWRPSAIKHILNNSAYRGLATFGKKKAIADESRLAKGFKRPFVRKATPVEQWLYIKCPTIVSEELWLSCQERAKTAQTQFSATAEKRHILSGLLRCPKCNKCLAVIKHSARYKDPEKRRVTCYCPNAYASLSIERKQCLRASFWEDELCKEIINVVIEATTRPDLIEAASEYFRDAQKSKYSSGELERLKTELAQAERKIQAAVEAQIQANVNGIDASVYETILRDTAQTRTLLRNRLERFQAAHEASGESARQMNNSIGADVAVSLLQADIPALALNKMLSRIIDAAFPSKEDGLKIIFRAGVFDANIRHTWQCGEFTAEGF